MPIATQNFFLPPSGQQGKVRIAKCEYSSFVQNDRDEVYYFPGRSGQYAQLIGHLNPSIMRSRQPCALTDEYLVPGEAPHKHRTH